MSRWFRLDDDVINDPKILLLPEQMRWIWVAFLCIASKNDGKIPAIEIVALNLRVKKTKAAEYLTKLVTAGLIDNDDGAFAPHNWAGRQYKSDVTDPTAASRQKSYRDRNKNRNGERNASVTNTDTREQNTETDTQTEKKKTRVTALAEGWSEADRSMFWEVFPNKIGKADAFKAFDKASHKTTPDVLFPALQQYAAKTDDRPFCNPATWLNQERWLDRPAAAPNGRRTVQQAADDLLANIRALDEPAPGGLLSPAREGVVRLIPSR